MESPGSIGGSTPASGTFTALQANTSLGVGSDTIGANASIVATKTELITSPIVTGGWTLGYDTGGWTISGGVLTKTASTGTVTATAVTGQTSAPVVGATYKVTIVCSAVSGTPSYTLGGVYGSAITATTITNYITAATTAKLILTGTASVTATITSISVQKLTDATGDITVDGDIVSRSQFLSSALQGASSGNYPQYSFSSDQTTGFGQRCGYTAMAHVFSSGIPVAQFSTSGFGILRDASSILMGASGDLQFGRDAANALALRNSGNQQTFRVYNTADATMGTQTNYERLSLTGVSGTSLNLTAETGGTGADNLDLILTAVGTGQVKTPNLVETAMYTTVSNTDTQTLPTATAGNRRVYSTEANAVVLTLAPATGEKIMFGRVLGGVDKTLVGDGAAYNVVFCECITAGVFYCYDNSGVFTLTP
jgi:hypothetical protein